jgi:WD40 repeat protein
VFEFASGREIQRLNLDENNKDNIALSPLRDYLTFSPAGHYLAILKASRRTVQVLDLDNQRDIPPVTQENDIDHVVFSPHGTYLAVGSDKALVYQATTGILVFSLDHNKKTVRTLTFSPDEKYLATAIYDGTVQVWDVASGRGFPSIKFDGRVGTVAFSHGGNYLAVPVNDNTVGIWDWAGWREIARINIHSWTNKIAFSPDDRYLNTLETDDDLAEMWLWQTCDLIKAAKDRLVEDDLSPEDWETYLGKDLQQYLLKGARPKTCQDVRPGAGHRSIDSSAH